MAETSTVKGSGLSSSTLVDLHGPGINKFWRKTSVDTNIRQVVDSNVSAIYGDLFNGTGESCMISGGIQNSYYLSDFPLASKPPYGDARLDGADFFFYVSDVDSSSEFHPGGTLPYYSFFMVDDNIGSGNEGTLKPYPTTSYPDSPVAVFSSFFDENVDWHKEDFSNGGKSIVVNGQAIKASDNYIPFEWAKDNIEWTNSFLSIAEESWWDKYTSTLPTGDKVIFIEKKDAWYDGRPQWEPTKGTSYSNLFDPSWKDTDVKAMGYPLNTYDTAVSYTQLTLPTTPYV